MTAAFTYGDLSSRIYDLDKPIGHSFGDVEYYSSRLTGVTGPVLEPAVGTGRILIPLLRDGLNVRGYDLSERMLEVCRANCEREGVDASVYVGDMLTHHEPETFEAVIVPTGSLILVPDREAVVTALRNFFDNLLPGGRLIVDIPVLNLNTTPPPMRYWRDGDELFTMQTMHVESDRVKQQLTQWLRYERWRDGRLELTELQVFELLWFGATEFRGMLSKAGFTDITVVGDYSAEAPTGESGVWTFEATRPSQR